MLRILQFLLTGDWHIHKWEDIKESQVTTDLPSIFTRYYCKCSICGKHKYFDVD